MAERRRDFAGNHEDDLENEWPSPLTTSFLEDYRRSNLSTAQRRPTHLSHSLTSSHINTPNSLQPSRCQTSTGGNLTPNPSNFEDALSETHFRLDSPYRPLELPSHFGFAEEETRRSYTPFPRLDTPPHSHSRSESRTSSNERAIGSSSHSPESDSFNAFVDLTQDSPKMPPPRRQAKSNKTISRSSSEELLKSVKRRKAGTTATSIEEVDLRDVDSDTDLARVLERQRVATVKAQQEEADKPTKLANVTCVVCMEEMTNMTATHCGMVLMCLRYATVLTKLALQVIFSAILALWKH